MVSAKHYCYDRCHICGEVLWIEWGFMTPQQCMMQEWYNRYPRKEIEVEEIDEIIEVIE